jgi:nitroreductase
MGGILPDKARENFAVPEEYEVVTALAIGYAGEPEGELGQRDQERRPRRSVEEFVFGENFGEAFGF